GIIQTHSEPQITIAPLRMRTTAGQPIERYGVRFLNASEVNPRKNLVGLLRAWLRGTSARDDAVLIVKLGRYVPHWFEPFRRQLELLQQSVGKGLDEAAPVHFIYDLFTDSQMPRLYATATHDATLSVGEGVDTAMVE